MIWLAPAICLALQTSPSELNTIENAALVEQLRHEAPKLDDATANLHLAAATRAACDIGVEPELLLALAYTESRFKPAVVSRLKTGRRFCGVLQVAAGLDEKRCDELADLDVGYREGAIVLKRWLVFAKGDLSAALNGYGCGVVGVKRGCRRFADRVLAWKRRLVVRSGS